MNDHDVMILAEMSVAGYMGGGQCVVHLSIIQLYKLLAQTSVLDWMIISRISRLARSWELELTSSGFSRSRGIGED
jgi:hypothetical protein